MHHTEMPFWEDHRIVTITSLRGSRITHSPIHPENHTIHNQQKEISFPHDFHI
jgi:hypothetical protein